MTQNQANAIADAADRLEASMERYDAMNSRELMSFPCGDVPMPQPTRAELIASARAWISTIGLSLDAFETLAKDGNRAGCQAAIESFSSCALMIVDRMREACP